MSTATSTLVAANRTRAVWMRDYSELVKARVTSLIVMTAWCGFYLGAARNGTSSVSWSMVATLLGVGLAAAGTAALNEAMEHDLDGRMRRTAIRPLVTGRMSLTWGVVLGAAMVLGGSLGLWLTTGWLAAALTFTTSLVYLLVYTPLKRVHPICTFVGAFPGAMPPLLGWVAARGRIEWQAVILFGIVFFWQFPHFHSIAWLYREDYERAGIRMLPVVESDGRSTVVEVLSYLVGLLVITLMAFAMGMAGWIYLAGAVLLGAGYLWFGWRLGASGLSPEQAASKRPARHLLQASVIYLPVLFALLILNATVS